jgi:hypothetical protein
MPDHTDDPSGKQMPNDADSVCGYAIHGGGGVSNQKMAILGVLLDGFETGLPVVLPHFTEMNQMAHKYDPFPFNEVFDESYIHEFCKRWNITLRRADEGTPYRNGYENYFWKTFNLFHSGMFDGHNRERDAFVADAIRSLRAHVASSRTVSALLAEIARYPNLAVAQFRIERDWKAHAIHLTKVHTLDEDIWLDHDKIARKIHGTLDVIEYLYVVCDEAALFDSKEKIRNDCFKATGLRLLFKSDFVLENERHLLGPLRLSLIDFEVARSASIFVGNSHSTFSNMVTLETYANFGRLPDQHYVYNKKGPLYRRQDHGLSTRP